MVRFLLDRVLQMAAALLVLSAVVFAMSRVTGDPVALLLPDTATPQEVQELRATLGLDKPLVVQYAIFLGDALHADLGRSYNSEARVSTLIWHGLEGSATLAIPAVVLAFVLGIPLGIVSATSRGTSVDVAVRLASLIGQAMPSFLVGILLIEVFAIWLHWLPSGTNQGPTYAVLPTITMAVYGIAGVARLLRSSAIEVLGTEFIKLVRAKGLPERLVVWKHMLRNSLLPVVSFLGLFFVNLLTVALVVEVVFAWPGLGTLTYTSLLRRDFPVIQGVTLLAGALAISVSTLADVIYLYLDPRIRLAGR